MNSVVDGLICCICIYPLADNLRSSPDVFRPYMVICSTVENWLLTMSGHKD